MRLVPYQLQKNCSRCCGNIQVSGWRNQSQETLCLRSFYPNLFISKKSPLRSHTLLNLTHCSFVSSDPLSEPTFQGSDCTGIPTSKTVSGIPSGNRLFPQGRDRPRPDGRPSTTWERESVTVPRRDHLYRSWTSYLKFRDDKTGGWQEGPRKSSEGVVDLS